MATTVNVQDAKTTLSELLRRVQAGDQIVIARAGKPVARLEPIEPRRRRFDLPLLDGIEAIEAGVLIEPMADDELFHWEQGLEGEPLGEPSAA